jgi:DNA-binding NarL/FixJ family response regulator
MSVNRRILVADYRDVIRAGLRRYVEGTAFRVVAEATSGREVSRLIRTTRPGILLLGCGLESPPIATLRRVRRRHRNLAILVFHGDDNPTHMARSLAWGASGCVSEGVPRGELLEALDLLARGESAWRADQLDLFAAVPEATELVKPRITPRERQVLRHLSYGLPNREIALILGISAETVKEHVASIRRKLGVRDRTKAAVWAIRHGLG